MWNKKNLFLILSTIVISVTVFVTGCSKGPDTWQVTRYRIRKLYVLCDNYREQFGRLPSEATWSTELITRPSAEVNLIDTEVREVLPLFFDAWDRPFKFRNKPAKLAGRDSFVIYSLGPNGIDEEGAGDDLLVLQE